MSVDTFLGLPFNWIGASVLQIMLAHVTGLTPGEFVWVGADCHIYNNHFDQVKYQLTREPINSPKLKIINKRDNIDDFSINDFEVTDYNPHGVIRGEVAV